MVFPFSGERGRGVLPPPTTEATRPKEVEQNFRETGKWAGEIEMVKILQPGGEFVGIPDVPEGDRQRRDYLIGFWSGMQKKIRESVVEGKSGVFGEQVDDWDTVDNLIGQKLTQAEFARVQGDPVHISMTDVQMLINTLAKEIPDDAMRPVN